MVGCESISTAWPPCLLFLGRMLTTSGRSTKPHRRAEPMERFWISCSVSEVMPSIEPTKERKSFGLVTFIINWVLHWARMVFCTKAGRCETTHKPRPNLRPSDEMRRKMSKLLALPKPFSGAKL